MSRNERAVPRESLRANILGLVIATLLGFGTLSCGSEKPQPPEPATSAPGVSAAKGESAGWVRGVPEYPDARIMGRVETRGSGTVTFTTPDAPSKVLEYYRITLVKQGWWVVTDASTGLGHTLAFEASGKSKDVISITATPKGGQSEVDASFVSGS